MAQWGINRTFTDAASGAKITGLPCVDTIMAFDPATAGSLIWKVLVLDQFGPEANVAELIAKANSYVGKPYSDWHQGNS